MRITTTAHAPMATLPIVAALALVLLVSFIAIMNAVSDKDVIVRSVIDGDTLIVGPNSVRLWGIDAPEISTEQGQKAKRFLAELVPTGSPLRCEFRARDSYGRVVARCFKDSVDIAETVLRAGHACEWMRYSHGFYRGVARCAKPSFNGDKK